MKLLAIEKRALKVISSLVLTGMLISRPAPAQVHLEKEYDKVVALLVDYQQGFLAVGTPNDEEGTIEKKVFKVDMRSVDIVNPANQYFDFAEIKSGHHLDIVTEIESDGKERVFEIVDYNLQETS